MGLGGWNVQVAMAVDGHVTRVGLPGGIVKTMVQLPGGIASYQGYDGAMKVTMRINQLPGCVTMSDYQLPGVCHFTLENYHGGLPCEQSGWPRRTYVEMKVVLGGNYTW